MNTWPLALQQSLNADQFTLTFGDTLLRTDMDVGPAKVRSRFTDAVDKYQATILLDYSQFQTLSDFYKTTLNNGALTFNFTDPMTSVTGIFRFVSPPAIQALGGRTFSVGLNWERLG